MRVGTQEKKRGILQFFHGVLVLKIGEMREGAVIKNTKKNTKQKRKIDREKEWEYERESAVEKKTEAGLTC